MYLFTYFCVRWTGGWCKLHVNEGKCQDIPERTKVNGQSEILRYEWEDIKINFHATLCDGVGFVHVARNRDQ
jgi:hypothetical protein